MANLGKSTDWPYATYKQIKGINNSLSFFANPHILGDVAAFAGSNFYIYGDIAYAKNPITLTAVNLATTYAAGRINLLGFPALTTFDISDSSVSHANVSKCRNLTTVNCEGNLDLLYLNVDCCPKLNAIYCEDSSISSQNIDDILLAIDKYGPNTGTFICDGASSGTPSSVGDAAITRLTTSPKNWSIITN